MHQCVCVSVRACVRVNVSACVSVCVSVCVRQYVRSPSLSSQSCQRASVGRISPCALGVAKNVVEGGGWRYGVDVGFPPHLETSTVLLHKVKVDRTHYLLCFWVLEHGLRQCRIVSCPVGTVYNDCVRARVSVRACGACVRGCACWWEEALHDTMHPCGYSVNATASEPLKSSDPIQPSKSPSFHPFDPHMQRPRGIYALSIIGSTPTGCMLRSHPSCSGPSLYFV